MRLLTLVRHGKSDWEHEGLQDFERPLNKRGWMDVPLMAKHFSAAMADKKTAPDLLIASYATRALTTARLFAAELNISLSEMRISEELFNNSVYDCFALLKQLESYQSGLQHACLFGHNPSMTDFTRALCPQAFTETIKVDSVPTASVVHLQLKIAHWHDTTEGCATLLSFDYPKKIKAERKP